MGNTSGTIAGSAPGSAAEIPAGPTTAFPDPTHNTGANDSLRSNLPASAEEAYPVYKSKYDYDARADDDLSFRKGDLMYIINTADGDWWFARSKDGSKEGYIPSKYVADSKTIEAEE